MSTTFAKLMFSLIWLNQTSAACALGDLAVAEAVYSRADQACAHCTRGIDTIASVVSGDDLGVYTQLLESNFEAIKEEFERAARLAEDNPHAGAFFQQEKESLAAERQQDWREVELFRRGFELKHCGLFPVTCAVARQLPEVCLLLNSPPPAPFRNSKLRESLWRRRASSAAPSSSPRWFLALKRAHISQWQTTIYGCSWVSLSLSQIRYTCGSATHGTVSVQSHARRNLCVSGPRESTNASFGDNGHHMIWW